MNLKRAKRLIDKIVYLKKLLRKYGKDLKPGKYHLFNNMHSIVLNDENTLALASKYFHKENESDKLTTIVSKVNKSKFYSNKKKSNCQEFDAIYFSNNHDKTHEVKLFSFERNEILTVCTSAEIREKQLAEYDTFHSVFGMPRVTPCDKYDNSYIISMVGLKERPAEAEALSHICRCVADYHKNNTAATMLVPVAETISFSYESQEMSSLLEKLVDKINNSNISSIPHCLQHGDLSQDNLIYGSCDGKEDFWWIDWEHAARRSFFYDYFFYILNTAAYFDDFEALEHYLSGESDETLGEFFNTFGLKFEAQHRIDYFLIFAVEFLKERVCDNRNLEALKMYYKFINENILDKK